MAALEVACEQALCLLQDSRVLWPAWYGMCLADSWFQVLLLQRGPISVVGIGPAELTSGLAMPRTLCPEGRLRMMERQLLCWLRLLDDAKLYSRLPLPSFLSLFLPCPFQGSWLLIWARAQCASSKKSSSFFLPWK